jgi:hypothetical protein
MMDCKQFREILDLYVDRELSAEATAQAESHLSACAACRRAAEQLNLLRGAVKQVVGGYEIPSELVERVQSRSRVGLRTHVALVAACMLVAIVATLAFSPTVKTLAADALESVAVRLDHPRHVVLEGKLLCRDDDLHARYGVHAMCRIKGHHGALEMSDGKVWNLIETEDSQELIHNSALLGRRIRVTGRLFRQSGALEVQSYQVL